MYENIYIANLTACIQLTIFRTLYGLRSVQLYAGAQTPTYKGSLQDRLRNLTPVPHSFEQVRQGAQGDHLPSTDTLLTGAHTPAIHHCGEEGEQQLTADRGARTGTGIHRTTVEEGEEPALRGRPER